MLGAWGIYCVAFAPISHLLLGSATMLSIIPLCLTGWLLGMRFGLLAGLLQVPLHAILFTVIRMPPAIILQQIPLVLAGSVTTIGIGWLSDLLGQLREQGEKTKQAENSLKQAHDELESRVQERTRALEQANAALGSEIAMRKRTEGELQQATSQLQVWVNELEQRNRQTGLLNEMGNLLQTCRTTAEAYAVAAQYAEKLFPGDSGALGILNSGRSQGEFAVTWGEYPQLDKSFAPEDCWALRRGQVHAVTDAQSRLVCSHISRPLLGESICVPMMAQGEALGILYLQEHRLNSRTGQNDGDGLSASRQNLALSMAERIALALANLNLRDTLRLQAIRDPLTGLYNRRYMEETLEREIKRATRHQTSLGVIMLDIDHFKGFNDTFGHTAGDLVLRQIGVALISNTRAEDVVCRYGGEEFLVILPEISASDLYRRTEDLRAYISALSVQYHDRTLQNVTFSAGLAMFPQDASSMEALLDAADDALYSAKRNGRNRVAIAADI